MPDAGTTVDAPSDAGLAGQIDALISTMGDGAAALAADQRRGPVDVASEVATAASGATGGPGAQAMGPDDVASLAAQIDTLVSEVEAASAGTSEGQIQGGAPAAAGAPDNGAPTAPVSAPDGPGDPSELGVPGLEEVLASALAGMGAPPGPAETPGGVEDTGGPAPVAGSADQVSLDAATGQADVQSPAQIDLSGLDAQLAAHAGPVVDPPRASTPMSVAPVLPVAPQASDPVVRGAVEPEGDRDGVLVAPAAPADGGVEPAPLRERLSGAVGAAASVAGPAARRLARLSASAYERSPAIARDTVGWIGLVTVFFACCMWAVVLFFRKIEAPEAYDVPSTVLEPGEPTPQPRPRPSAADEHAAPAESHAESKPEPAGDHGGGGGGGGGHH